MGLNDRDWYREEIAARQRTARAGAPHNPFAPRDEERVWLVFAIVVALVLLLLGLYWMSRPPAKSTPRPNSKVLAAEPPRAAPRRPESPQAAVPPPVVEQTLHVRPEERSAGRPADHRVASPSNERDDDIAARPSEPANRTLYLCKAYAGGSFWSSQPCSAHRALLDRAVTVPGGMDWSQQVDFAERQRQSAERLSRPDQGAGMSPSAGAGFIAPGGTGSVECAHLETQIERLRSLERQTSDGAMLARYAADRSAVWQRIRALRC